MSDFSEDLKKYIEDSSSFRTMAIEHVIRLESRIAELEAELEKANAINDVQDRVTAEHFHGMSQELILLKQQNAELSKERKRKEWLLRSEVIRDGGDESIRVMSNRVRKDQGLKGIFYEAVQEEAYAYSRRIEKTILALGKTADSAIDAAIAKEQEHE